MFLHSLSYGLTQTGLPTIPVEVNNKKLSKKMDKGSNSRQKKSTDLEYLKSIQVSEDTDFINKFENNVVCFTKLFRPFVLEL